jgi:hypothetical protein
MTIFCSCCFANKSKTTIYGKNQTKNTGFFLKWMDFVDVRTKINKSSDSLITFDHFDIIGPKELIVFFLFSLNLT